MSEFVNAAQKMASFYNNIMNQKKNIIMSQNRFHVLEYLDKLNDFNAFLGQIDLNSTNDRVNEFKKSIRTYKNQLLEANQNMIPDKTTLFVSEDPEELIRTFFDVTIDLKLFKVLKPEISFKFANREGICLKTSLGEEIKLNKHNFQAYLHDIDNALEIEMNEVLETINFLREEYPGHLKELDEMLTQFPQQFDRNITSVVFELTDPAIEGYHLVFSDKMIDCTNLLYVIDPNKVYFSNDEKMMTDFKKYVSIGIVLDTEVDDEQKKYIEKKYRDVLYKVIYVDKSQVSNHHGLESLSISSILNQLTLPTLQDDEIQSKQMKKIYGNIDETLRAYKTFLMEKHMVFSNLKSEASKVIKDEKNSVAVKIDWTITNYEMKTRQNIDDQVKVLIDHYKDLSTSQKYVLDKVFCVEELKEDLYRMQESLKKKLLKSSEKHHQKYRMKTFNKEDILNYDVKEHELVEQKFEYSEASMLKHMPSINTVELNLILNRVFSNTNLFLAFSKKKKILQLQKELRELLDSYVRGLKKSLLKNIFVDASSYLDSTVNELMSSFELEIFPQKSFDYMILHLNSLIKESNLPDEDPSIKKIILRQ